MLAREIKPGTVVSYNQYSILLGDVEIEISFLTEELEGILELIYNDECGGIALPSAFELQITECDPAVKGDSATSRTRAATVQTGYSLQVPDYLPRHADNAYRCHGILVSKLCALTMN